MQLKDYYKVLGLTDKAGDDDIKKAFRQLAKKYHPDAHPGDKAAEERFKEISEAYEVLSNTEKKAQYEKLKQAQAGGYDFSNMGRGGQNGNYQGNVDFSSIFGDMFGQNRSGGFSDIFDMFFENGQRGRGQSRGRSAAPQKGDDVNIRIKIPFDLSLKGGETIVKVPRASQCTLCGGTGAAPGTGVQQCPTCNGSGSIHFSQGGFMINKPCPNCDGRGTVIKTPCIKCAGTGSEKEIEKIRIKIPQGVTDGTKLKISGHGDYGKGGRGDLYVIFGVEESAQFERRGDDLYYGASINLAQAALGSEIEIPLTDGAVKVKIPAGTQPGSAQKIKGKGAKNIKTGKNGDLIIVINVEIPLKLNDKEKKLIQELAKLKDMKY
ncbi:MAG: J domain-containing protein [Candidatus Goldbacteria bacterium]|nr:J domain-containing protein [Candidatus Goldiibacteriota bacterium]